MPTAPSCHVFSSPVGTHFCAHCLHGRESSPPEKVAFGSLPLSEEPDLLCVFASCLLSTVAESSSEKSFSSQKRLPEADTDLSFVGKILPEELIKFLTVGCLKLGVHLSCSYI